MEALLLRAVATASASTAPNATSAHIPSPSAPPVDAPPIDAPSFYLVYAAIYACGALFFVPCGVAFMRMWRNRRIDATAVKLFSLLGMGALLRALAFVLVGVWMLFVAQSRGTAKEAKHLHLSYLELVFLWQLLGMFGSFALGGVFLLVFNTWASMIEQVNGAGGATSAASHGVTSFSTGQLRRASSSSSPPPRVLFIKMVVAIYVLQIITFVVLQPAPTSVVRRSMYLVATVLLAFCFVVCIFLLPAYGRRMCGLLDKVAEDASHRQRNIRRIAAIATVFCLMRTVSLLLLAASQYRNNSDQQQPHNNSDDNDRLVPDKVFEIPTRDLIEENPIFFFTASGGSASTGLLRWVVLLEVSEFPLEWTLLVGLLCVLPSKAVLPSIRGYQPIAEKKWRQ